MSVWILKWEQCSPEFWNDTTQIQKPMLISDKISYRIPKMKRKYQWRVQGKKSLSPQNRKELIAWDKHIKKKDKPLLCRTPSIPCSPQTKIPLVELDIQSKFRYAENTKKFIVADPGNSHPPNTQSDKGIKLLQIKIWPKKGANDTTAPTKYRS